MGTPDFAVAPLEALVKSGCDVVAVVTVADKPAGRGLQLRESPVKVFAKENGIPVMQPLKLKDPEFVEQFLSYKPDLAIVVAFRMLPEVIWSAPKFGTFNLHASLLPFYRGAAPINWAIINGDNKTGVTTFFLNHDIDCGDIIDSKEVEITNLDNVGTLHDKLMNVGASLVLDTVDKITKGTCVTRKQEVVSDPVRVLAPKIFKDDCKIDWNSKTIDVYNKIRGLSPYPAAWTEINGINFKIFEADYSLSEHNEKVGLVSNEANKYVKITCPDGHILIKKLQPAGKKMMFSEDFLRGHKL